MLSILWQGIFSNILYNTDRKEKFEKDQDIYSFIHEFWKNQNMSNLECFITLLFDKNGDFLSIKNLFKGGKSSVKPSAFVLELYLRLKGAKRVIIAHNHPSNNPFPSDKDIEMNSAIAAHLNQIDIVLHDSIILVDDGYYSDKLGTFLKL